MTPQELDDVAMSVYIGLLIGLGLALLLLAIAF